MLRSQAGRRQFLPYRGNFHQQPVKSRHLPLSRRSPLDNRHNNNKVSKVLLLTILEVSDQGLGRDTSVNSIHLSI